MEATQGDSEEIETTKDHTMDTQLQMSRLALQLTICDLLQHKLSTVRRMIACGAARLLPSPWDAAGRQQRGTSLHQQRQGSRVGRGCSLENTIAHGGGQSAGLTTVPSLVVKVSCSDEWPTSPVAKYCNQDGRLPQGCRCRAAWRAACPLRDSRPVGSCHFWLSQLGAQLLLMRRARLPLARASIMSLGVSSIM